MKTSDSRALVAYVDSLRSMSLDDIQARIVATCASGISPSGLDRAVRLLTEETFQSRETDLPKVKRFCSAATKAPCAGPPRPKERVLGSLSLGGVKLCVEVEIDTSVCGGAAFLDKSPWRQWLPDVVGDEPGRVLRCLDDIDALPLIRLQEITRRLGMAAAWRAHENLRGLQNVGELGSRHRLSLRVGQALYALTLLSIRLERIPKLRILSECLERNSAEFLDIASGRLRALVGEADSSKALIAAAREARACLGEGIFEGSLHVTSEMPGFLRGLMFSPVKMEDVSVRITEFLCAAEAGRACQHALLVAIRELERFLFQVESDWVQVKNRASGATRVLDPITQARLSHLLLTSGPEALHDAKCEGNEVQRLVEQTSRTFGELSAVIVELIRSIRTETRGRLSLAELEVRYESYLYARNRLLGRVQQAARKLDCLSQLVRRARDRHVTREIDLLVDLVEHSEIYAAALRVRAVVTSVKGLAQLAQRALCRLICNEMHLPSTYR